MKELIGYREKMLKRFEEAAQEFFTACKSASNPFAKVEGEWNVHQIASHTRDVEKLVYGMRIRRTLTEDNPELQNFDADEWMATHYDPQEPLDKILDEFLTDAEALCKTLAEQPQEIWSRESRHEALGDGLTLQVWVERNLAHIEEHLKTVKKS